MGQKVEIKVAYQHCELYEFRAQEEKCENQCDSCQYFEDKHL